MKDLQCYKSGRSPCILGRLFDDRASDLVPDVYKEMNSSRGQVDCSYHTSRRSVSD
jgi:hypothetical protein